MSGMVPTVELTAVIDKAKSDSTEDALISVIFELRPVKLSLEGMSVDQQIATKKLAFVKIAMPFVTAIIAVGGGMPLLSWLQCTISVVLSVSQIQQLLARGYVGDAILDIPSPLISE